jgi:hypothetical protein
MRFATLSAGHSNPEVRDPYEVLGVPRQATHAQLKAAHRRLVLQHHPDLQPPEARAVATRTVQDINVAYGMLRDGRHRAVTDAALHRSDPGPQWDDLVTEAGRWAGRWWRRERPRIVAAARAGGRGAVSAIGRLIWLGATLVGGILGFLLATALGRMVVGEAVVGGLAGLLGGMLVGSEYGSGRARRMARIPVPAWPLRVAAGLFVAAVAGGLFLDSRI